jgi:MFS family permease
VPTVVSIRSGKTAPASGAVVALLALAIFINYLDRGNLATAAPLIKGELKLSNTQISLLISAFFWVYVPGQLLAAWLVSKINAYRTLTVGVAIWSAATVLMGLAQGFVALLALRLLLGLGESAGFPASSKLLAQHLPVRRLGSANALISTGIMLGPAAGTLLGGLLIAHTGWRLLFVVFGGLSTLWLAPWLTGTRALSLVDDDTQTKSNEPTLRALMARRELWAASIGHFAGNYVGYFVLSWLPLYLVKVQGFSITAMAEFGGLVYVLSAACSLIAGFLADWWMARGASSNLARKSFIGASSAISVVCMLMCALGGPKIAITGLLLSSLGNGLGSFNVYAIGQTLAGPVAAGKWVGVQNCIGNISGIVAPVATGVVIDVTGHFTLAFVVAAFIAGIGLFCWTIGIRRIEPIVWRSIGSPALLQSGP